MNWAERARAHKRLEGAAVRSSQDSVLAAPQGCTPLKVLPLEGIAAVRGLEFLSAVQNTPHTLVERGEPDAPDWVSDVSHDETVREWVMPPPEEMAAARQARREALYVAPTVDLSRPNLGDQFIAEMRRLEGLGLVILTGTPVYIPATPVPLVMEIEETLEASSEGESFADFLNEEPPVAEWARKPSGRGTNGSRRGKAAPSTASHP